MSSYDAEQAKRGRRTFLWLYGINRNSKYLKIDLAVATEITAYVNKTTHGAFPSAKTIGDNIHASERSVLRSIRRLEAGGDLSVKWGSKGRKHSNHYFPNLPSLEDEKTGTITPVFEDGKPASVAQKTGTAVPENHQTNHGDTFGVPQGERSAAAAASGGPALLGPPRRRESKKEAGCGSEDHAALLALQATWDRGHAADATKRQRAADAAAWAAALAGGATAEAVLAGAEKWKAAADAPRYLPKLSDWLDTHSWEKPPPKRGRQRANGCWPRKDKANGLSAAERIFAAARGRMQ